MFEWLYRDPMKEGPNERQPSSHELGRWITVPLLDPNSPVLRQIEQHLDFPDDLIPQQRGAVSN